MAPRKKLELMYAKIFTTILVLSSWAAADNKVFGQCIVLAGNGNLDEIPCPNLTLKLEPAVGKDILYTRTNENGLFEFTTKGEGKFTLGVMSRLYEVVAPTAAMSGTRKINLQLRQK